MKTFVQSIKIKRTRDVYNVVCKQGSVYFITHTHTNETLK